MHRAAAGQRLGVTDRHIVAGQVVGAHIVAREAGDLRREAQAAFDMDQVGPVGPKPVARARRGISGAAAARHGAGRGPGHLVALAAQHMAFAFVPDAGPGRALGQAHAAPLRVDEARGAALERHRQLLAGVAGEADAARHRGWRRRRDGRRGAGGDRGQKDQGGALHVMLREQRTSAR
jgi:hypothetical protein